jgi:hypothetical protein
MFISVVRRRSSNIHIIAGELHCPYGRQFVAFMFVGVVIGLLENIRAGNCDTTELPHPKLAIINAQSAIIATLPSSFISHAEFSQSTTSFERSQRRLWICTTSYRASIPVKK